MIPDGSNNLDTVAILDSHGVRKYVQPADVKGRFRRAKPFVYGILIALYMGLPFIPVGGHPAVHISIPKREFFFFGMTFNAQDFYLAFFMFSGIGFALIVISALWGRIWCGWACPQTVFLDGVFRRIERWIEGPRNKRIKLEKAPWTFDKIWRKTLKHIIYLAIAFVISHVFLSYFVTMPALGTMVTSSPAEHMTPFLWGTVMTALLYFNFWWFREQLCMIVCPYGRLQSALGDDDTWIIGYDVNRGEPRGKAKDPEAGDCVNCNRCVVVCPTGIDIRDGLQLECIGCAYCIDACDEIMDKLGRPRGLVRYDTHNGFHGIRHRFWRPRVFGYAFAAILGLVVWTVAVSGRTPFEAKVMHIQGAPFTVQDGVLRNQLRINTVNKHGETATFSVTVSEAAAGTEVEGLKVILPQPTITLASFLNHQIPVIIELPVKNYRPNLSVVLIVSDSISGESQVKTIKLLGPAVPTASPTSAPNATPDATPKGVTP